jgi:hypothetical protein
LLLLRGSEGPFAGGMRLRARGPGRGQLIHFLLPLLLLTPGATFLFSYADARLEHYNAISSHGFFPDSWDVYQSKEKMRVRQVRAMIWR